MRATDVLVTVALEVAAFIVVWADDDAMDSDDVDGVDDDGALLKNAKHKII